jgi:hypothetical protein
MKNALIIDSLGKFVEINNTTTSKIGLIIGIVNYRDVCVNLLSPTYNLEYIYLSPKNECRILNSDEINKLFNPIKVMNRIPFQGCNNGADPEVFVVDKDDNVIPAFTFLPDKKCGNPFWDGFQAEFTIIPTSCLSYMVDYIRDKLRSVLQKAQAKDPNAKLTWKSVMDVPCEILQKTEHKYIELGCAPSQNIYGIEITRPDPMVLPLRFAGCHLHFGLDQKVRENKFLINNIIKYMDSLFGIISVSLLQGMEDPRRRLFYGLAGEHRLPPHGIEYRVPSSAILAHPALFHLCFDIIRASLYLAQYDIMSLFHIKNREEEIIDIINNYDLLAAKKYLNRHKTIIILILDRIYCDRGKEIFALITDGFRNNVDISSMEKNWILDSDQWSCHSESKNCNVSKLELPSNLLE